MRISTVVGFLIIALAFILYFAVIFKANAAPVEVWLTPAKAKALSRITAPRIVSKKSMGDQVVYTWDDGLTMYATTQAVKHVTGKAAKSAWGTKLAQKEAEKEKVRADILDDVRKLGSKPVKKDLDNLVLKYEKQSPGGDRPAADTNKDDSFSNNGGGATPAKGK